MRLRILLLLLPVLMLLAIVPTVSAATVAFAYSLDTSSPTLTNKFNNSGSPCEVAFLAESYYYNVVHFSVTADGVYRFFDLNYDAPDFEDDNPDYGDGLISFHTGSFDPTSPGDNCFFVIDDNYFSPNINHVTLQAGVDYIMVQSTFHVNDTGTFGYRVSGPGDILIPGIISSGGGSDSPAGPPCNNLFDGRINDNQSLDCAAPVAIYIVEARVDVYAINPNNGTGSLVIQSAPESEDGAPDGTAEASGNILLGSSGNIRLYWLPETGEYLLRATYSDGKPYEVVWSGDGSDLRHTAA